MQIDRYSKVTLTIIAIALTVIAAAQLAPSSVVAQGQLCGTYYDPCYVTNATKDALYVIATDPSERL